MQWEFFYVRCCAHILNLIGQEGLKVTSEAIHKIRDSIKYVRQSEVRMMNFRKYVEEVGGIDTSLGLKLDVLTRRNSTHAMLENALTYRKAFFCLAFHDHDYHHYLTDEEWSLVDRICKFLKPFPGMTILISGSSYSTANMYFLQISKIESHLKEHAHGDDLVIRDLAMRMLDKFDKYCSDYSVILALATILDPRMKFDAIKFSYSNLDPIICNEKIENIRSKLYHVFSEYKDMGSSSSLVPSVGGESSSYVNESMTLPPSSPHHTINKKDEDYYGKAFADYFKFKRKNTTITIEKSELDFYLEEEIFDPKMFIELDVLNYWTTNSARFPCLSKMACDIFYIPIATVASKSALGIGSQVLTKYQSRPLPENVEALVCIHNWLLGFPHDEESGEKESDDVSAVSNEASYIIIEDV